MPRTWSAAPPVVAATGGLPGGGRRRLGFVLAAAFSVAYLDDRLLELASSAAVAGLPAVLRVPLSEPTFVLGALFVAVWCSSRRAGLVGLARRRGGPVR